MKTQEQQVAALTAAIKQIEHDYKYDGLEAHKAVYALRELGYGQGEAYALVYEWDDEVAAR